MADRTAGALQAIAEGWTGLKARDLAPVAVAVLDSGIDGSHPDLRGRVVSAITLDMEDERAIVRTLDPAANNDAFGHGTSVAGIIAAIAPNAIIHDVRVLGRSNTGGTEILLGGVRYALEQPWRLLNLSLAATTSIRTEFMALCERAYYQEQIVVASRRNLPLSDNGLPAEFSSCIGVDRGNYATPFDFDFRARTPIEFVAHGEAIVAPAQGGGYKAVTGTSFATPVVCGLCAILVGAYPDLKLFEIKTILRHLAGKSGSSAGVST